MNHLHKIDVKFFATKGEDIDAYTLMGVFQKWIRKHTIPGVLVDVADYSHMAHGPGVILVAHEFNVSIDYLEGRMGLLYHRKMPFDGIFEERVRLAIQAALDACVKLEEDEELRGRIGFDASGFRFMASDRLHAPNNDETYEQLRQQVYEVTGQLYAGEVEIQRVQDDPRDRLILDVNARETVNARELLARTTGQEVG